MAEQKLLERSISKIEGSKIRLELDVLRNEILKDFQKKEREFLQYKSDFDWKIRVLNACHESPVLFNGFYDTLTKEINLYSMFYSIGK